jgi:hypothetical protein
LLFQPFVPAFAFSAFQLKKPADKQSLRADAHITGEHFVLYKKGIVKITHPSSNNSK